MTFGQLVAMHDANQRTHWSHTSAIVAAIINTNRKKGSKAVKPEDLNPYIATGKQGTGIPLTKDNLHILKNLRGVRSADRKDR